MNSLTDKNRLLFASLEQLNVTPGFIEKAHELGFHNLNDIVSPGWGELQRMPGFNYTWFNELVRLLESHQLLGLLEKPAG